MSPDGILKRSILSGIFLTSAAFASSGEISDDFERSEVGDAWTGHMYSFSIKDGALVASQLPDAGHGAVIRTQLDFRNMKIDFDVKFEGGERFNFVIDDKNCEEVHAGHICRVSITRNRLTVQDDRNGAMNLKLRELRRQPEKAAEIEAFLETTKSSGDFESLDGRWYHMQVVIENNQMSASLDGKIVAKLTSPGIAHPTKTQFGFTVTGRDILFDNVVAVGTK